MFAKYDTDGDRILDPEEQRHLAEDLLKQKDSLNAELSKIQEQQKDGETPASLADLMVRLTSSEPVLVAKYSIICSRNATFFMIRKWKL